MASLQHLSDEELRSKLKEFGIVSPITASTRNVLLKKLNHMMHSNKSKLKPVKTKNTSTLDIVSSDEEGSPFSQPTRQLRHRKSDANPVVSHSSSASGISKTSANPKILETNENVCKTMPNSYARKSLSHYSSQRRSVSSSPSSYLSYDSTSDSEKDEISFKSSNEKNTYDVNDSVSSNDLFNKDFDLLFSRSNVSENNSSKHNLSNNYNTLFTNKIERKLLNNKFGDYTNLNSKPTANGRKLEVDAFSEPKPDGHLCWHQSIPLLLKLLLICFFAFLGMCYFNMHIPLISGISSYFNHLVMPHLIDNQSSGSSHHMTLLGEDDKDFPLCSEKISLSCLSHEESQSVPEVLRVAQKFLLPELRKHDATYQCGYVALPYMTVNEIGALFSSHINGDVIPGIVALGKLAILHPNLGIKAVVDGETRSVLGLKTANPSTHVICHVILCLYYAAYICSCGIAAGAIVWCCIILWNYLKKRNEKVETQMFDLVDKILEILESCAATGTGKDYVAVSHVRDCLISPRERQKMKTIWDQAVNFINNDSRIYREIRTVAGEATEVWRWIPGAPHTPSTKSENHQSQKSWQGQAFYGSEKAQNFPQVSPTSCLKIRNMFDCEVEFGDDWPVKIQDSILEKCEGIDIVHIAVDKASREGLVYLKCRNSVEAGRAFRALHGCWFDGNLVTVKYLKNERYHEKFPASRHSSVPLVPSSRKRNPQKLHQNKFYT